MDCLEWFVCHGSVIVVDWAYRLHHSKVIKTETAEHKIEMHYDTRDESLMFA